MPLLALLLLALVAGSCDPSVPVRTVRSEPTQDRQALLAFVAAVPHEPRLRWNVNTSACDWAGVACDSARAAVVSLRLPGVGLVGPLPAGILGRLSALPAVGRSGDTGMTSSSKDEMSGSGTGAEAERNRLVFVGISTGYSFDLEDLLRASAEVLGKGSTGTSYKAVLEEGTTVVVKRLKDVAAAKPEFESHMQTLGKVEHANLLTPRAYYYSKDEKLLVLDYLPSGSLSSLLHGTYRGVPQLAAKGIGRRVPALPLPGDATVLMGM
ncbi:hypothetical protein GW17_00041829 [Ensete ventricosum]|nr:hypothetical protein GW17_00041829 [Ensete ventricosum]